MTDLLLTPRLELRPLTPEDAPMIFALNGDPEVMRHLPKDEVYTSEAEAADFLQRYLERSRHSRFARWAVVRRSDGVAVGWCGLKEDDKGDVDLGYRLLREHWAQGYATEASRAWLNYGFGPAGLERIIARAAEGNLASQAVLMKLGFARIPEKDHVEDDIFWRKFYLDRADWEAIAH